MEKRRYRVLLAIVAFMIAMTLCVAIVAGCGDPEPEPTPNAPTVTAISLDTSGAKTTYNFGETFSTAGLKVTAKMSDDKTQNIELSDCRVNPPNMQQAGDQTVVVTHTASRKTASYKVTVKQRPIDETPLVEITENADNAFRVEAEAINMEITEVKSTAEDGSFITNFEVEEGKPEVASKNSALANFGTSGNFFAFSFKSDKAYTGVTMEVAVANTSGNLANIQAGLDVQVNEVSTGLKGVLSNSASVPYTWHKFFAEELSVKEGLNSVYFYVTGDIALAVDYIDFYVGKEADVPEKKSFVNITEATTYVQEAEKDLVLTDFVSQGGGADLKIENSVLASDGKSIGAVGANSTFTVGITSNAKATVRIIARIAKYEGRKVSDWCTFMFDGESIDMGDRELSGGYGSSNDTMYFNWNDVVIGEFDIEVGKAYDFVFNTPTGAINIDALKFAVLTYGETATDEIKALPTPNAYIDATGKFTVEAEGLDASTWKNTDGAGYGEISQASGGKSIGHLAEGSVINVNFKLSDKATILVNGFMAKAEADYNLADSITATFKGVDVKIPEITFGGIEGNTYHNWQTVNMGRYDLDPGIYTLAITVKEGKASPNIDCFEFTALSYGAFTNAEISGIKITGQPNKRSYYEGDMFDPTGMKVMLIGTGGKELFEISDSIRITPNGALTAADTTVTVAYGEYTQTLEIQITAMSSIEIVDQPTKTEYNEGDRFDPAGMTVKGIFADGKEIDLTAIVTYDKLVGANGVTVRYGAKTATPTITVGEKLVREVDVTANGTYTVEGESINRDGVITRDDMINAYGLFPGEVRFANSAGASGGKAIEAFETGTTFTLKLKTSGAAKIAINMIISDANGGDASKYVGIKFGDTSLTSDSTIKAGVPGTDESQYYNWDSADFGSINVTEAGEHTIVITANARFNFDNITFTVTDYAA